MVAVVPSWLQRFGRPSNSTKSVWCVLATYSGTK